MKQFLAWLRGRFAAWELRLIVYPIEGLWRLWYHLDPRVYLQPLRMRGITAGLIAKKSDRFLLFVLYERNTVAPFTETLIKAVAKTPLNLIITTNARITPQLRKTLLENCHLLVERADLGRDFGGYRDGISILRSRYDRIDRLILLNDSLFFLAGNVDALIAGLDGEADVIGMTEIFEHHYHIGSYAISFGPRVLRNGRFLKYWRRYRPITTRRWSIHKGEVGLTRTIVEAGFKPRILYHASLLYPHLLAADAHELLSAIYLLPAFFRAQLYAELDELRVSHTTATLKTLDSIGKSVRRLRNIDSKEVIELRNMNVTEMLTINAQSLNLYGERQRRLFEDFGRRIVGTIAAHNQMHVGGFLFTRYLGMPAFKRDIFYREVYRFEDIDEVLTIFAEPLKEQIMADIRQKGTQQHLRGLQRILAKHGSI